jgi:sterol desaturase/sphingolipid hydroxylase (fatty acid hydroxylase superfamily)
MVSQEELYQVITFIGVVALFDSLERFRPGFPVDRKHDLSINILAMVIVIIVGEIWKSVISQGFSTVGLRLEIFPGLLHRIPGGLKILLAVILTDFSLYWVHRYMHRPLLWRTHSFHHSIAEIWWLAGSRTSVTHLFLFAVPQIIIGRYIFALSAWETGVAYSFAVVVNLWVHTNIWVDIGPLEWLLITPNYHRIHHGATGLGSSNLAFVFTVWDRMFGTYADPKVLGKDYKVFSVPTGRRLARMIAGI